MVRCSLASLGEVGGLRSIARKVSPGRGGEEDMAEEEVAKQDKRKEGERWLERDVLIIWTMDDPEH